MDVNDLKNMDWFQQLCSDITAELESRQKSTGDRRPALESEMKQIDEQIAGWTMSLGNAALSLTVRSTIEQSLEQAVQRRQHIEHLISEEGAARKAEQSLLDPQLVVDRLNRLDEVLANNNPSMGNIELSYHIDRIDCYPNGRVVLRTSKLGALSGAIGLLQDETRVVTNDKPVQARRRGRLRIDDSDNPHWETAAEWATDPKRFAGLSEEWFEEEEFFIPEKSWPYQEMADQVAKCRLAGMTHEELALKFGTTVPTIRKSLQHAAKSDKRLDDLPRKMPRSRWHEDHALEVAAMKADGLGTNELVAHFKKSDTTIRKALVHAEQLAED